MVQIPINLARHGCRKVSASVRSASNYHNRELRIYEWRIGSKEAHPVAIFFAGTGFAGNRL